MMHGHVANNDKNRTRQIQYAGRNKVMKALQETDYDSFR
jgi:hypothetical protein